MNDKQNTVSFPLRNWNCKKIRSKTIGIILISPTIALMLYVISIEFIEFVSQIGLSGLVYILLNVLIGIVLFISSIVGCCYLLKPEEK